MKILITGGAGFIGYHLAKRLSSEGHNITIADNFFRGKRDAELGALLKNPNVHLVEADLSQKDAWNALGKGYDQVYHLVGINGTNLFYEIPHEVLRIGVASTMHALDWFRGVNGVPDAKILYTSSNEAYASALEAYGSLPLPTPENVPLVIADTYNPRWSYGGQKLIGELFFIHYAKAYNFRMVIVRPHNFYGPRSGYGHVIPGTLEKIRVKTDPFPLPGADETRSFCYIDDAVEAMQVVMGSRATDGGTYHIGNPNELSMEALVQEIFNIAKWHPKTLEKKLSPAGSVKRRLPDVSKLKRDTGWEAKTTLEEGLRKTVEWYLLNPKGDSR
ncbi:MAG: NDP-sugar dehydratase or epimerase [Parcubacteria group bacterium Gr01-1014_8]|nr:MAG: NDP-sugar dehydratase or epimerase [Parcubacteria group bacterium Gr01-1014_8]